MKTIRFRSALLALLLAAVADTGCGGEPRLDVTSEKTSKTSMDAMTVGMDEGDKRLLVEDVRTILLFDMVDQAALPKGVSPRGVDRKSEFKAVDGLTVAEIRAKAAALRAKGKIPPPPGK